MKQLQIKLVWQRIFETVRNIHMYIGNESNEYEETTVLLFWSEEAYAKRHLVNEWSDAITASAIRADAVTNAALVINEMEAEANAMIVNNSESEEFL